MKAKAAKADAAYKAAQDAEQALLLAEQTHADAAAQAATHAAAAVAAGAILEAQPSAASSAPGARKRARIRGNQAGWQAMRAAVADVQAGRLNKTEAAAEHGVNRITLLKYANDPDFVDGLPESAVSHGLKVTHPDACLLALRALWSADVARSVALL
jgi:hypothetical protein